MQCVFHGIRFKVNKDWLSGIDSLLFLYTLSFFAFPIFFCYFSLSSSLLSRAFSTLSTKNIIFAADLPYIGTTGNTSIKL
ncbi:hypothetical protein IA74_008195 [Bacteroides fragilis]|uniref:Transmembrane protein n=2 Tax=Bacteroides TaxID=816 RepID=A0AAP9CYL5_BACFG|nr:hypothetical protein IB64_009490 [Bacteroides fragilis]QCQ36090.1 hypothetical protein IA74_008195 [Bacteroides fragilis]QRM69977.1 hypothetical protein F7887_08200 [Bacteroides fragilis]RHH67424.1 hypothetical protein DW198_12490 [Bacteroides fragilis]